jgi:hypothetical protein
MHEAKESITPPPRTVGAGYSDTELLYGDLTSGFDGRRWAGVISISLSGGPVATRLGGLLPEGRSESSGGGAGR